MGRNLNAESLGEFFREMVREAMGHQKVDIPESTEFYLVNLLQESLKSDTGLSEEPLAVLYCRALQADYALKISLLKKLGDVSLYTAGFFPESFSRQLVDTDYYIQMGEAAYDDLSHLYSRKNSVAEIFQDLAQRFPAYVDIFSEVSEKSFSKKATDLLRLYETWQKTGSKRTQEILIEKGILPVDGTSRKLQ